MHSYSVRRCDEIGAAVIFDDHQYLVTFGELGPAVGVVQNNAVVAHASGPMIRSEARCQSAVLRTDESEQRFGGSRREPDATRARAGSKCRNLVSRGRMNGETGRRTALNPIKKHRKRHRFA